MTPKKRMNHLLLSQLLGIKHGLTTNVPDPFQAAVKIVENDKEFDSKDIIPIKEGSHFCLLEGEYCLEISRKNYDKNDFVYIKLEHIGLEMYKQIYRINSNQINGAIKFTSLSRAFLKRQTDTGWGWSLSFLIPLSMFYYTISRRTITPLLYIVCLYMVILIAGITINSFWGFLFLQFISIPICFLGIQKSRLYGAERLKNMQIGSDNYKIIFFPKLKAYTISFIRRFILKTLKENSKHITFDKNTRTSIGKLDSLFLRGSISIEEYKKLKNKILN